MACQNPGCIKQYDYECIAVYARMRYVEGVSTIMMLCNATTESEKIQISLACLLDLDDDKICDLLPACSRKCLRHLCELRRRLRVMIEHESGRRLAA